MSDPLCGPSNALKSFGEHADQDRSRHQDRTRQALGANQNFRSTPSGPGNEAEFQAFASDMPAFAHGLPVTPELSSQSPSPFQPAMHQQHVAYWASTPAGMPTALPMAGPTTLPRAGLGAAHSGGDWAQEFQGSQYQPQHLSQPASVPHFQSNNFGASHYQMHQYTQQQPLSTFGANTVSNPMAVPMMQNNPYMASQHQQAFSDVTNAASTAPANVMPALTEEALEARFAQLEADLEFEREMDGWMTEHGPTAEERGEVDAAPNVLERLKNLEVGGSNAAEQDSLAEQTAAALDEQFSAEHQIGLQDQAAQQGQDVQDDRNQLDQDELVQTAEKIVNTLAAHPSDRFRESAFVGLMRRIQAREVVVQDDVFVESATGLPVENSIPTSANNVAEGMPFMNESHQQAA